jgi:hypothetical protein
VAAITATRMRSNKRPAVSLLECGFPDPTALPA